MIDMLIVLDVFMLALILAVVILAIVIHPAYGKRTMKDDLREGPARIRQEPLNPADSVLSIPS